MQPVAAAKSRSRAGKATANKGGSVKTRASGAAQLRTPVLSIHGAMQHNLKHVSLELEHNTLNVFCGPSGSGKSSLAMDTIYAEGQRRYVESLSSYARQFVGQMPKPPIERIDGLAPAIAIEQKSVAHNPRSTVGTVTEIYDYLRVLMARLGTPHCPQCHVPVSTQTAQEIAATIMKQPEGSRLMLAAPMPWRANQTPEELWQELRSSGLQRVRLDGKIYSIDQPPRLNESSVHDLQVVIDRVVVSKSNRARIAESVELALSRGAGVMFTVEPDETQDESLWKCVRHSQHLACRQCGLSLETLSPHAFSFNTPLGWCSACEGLGTQTGADPNLLVDMSRPLLSGGLRLFPFGPQEIAFEMLAALAKNLGIAPEEPIAKLSGSVRRSLFYGTGERWHRLESGQATGLSFQWKGLIPTLEEASRLSPFVRNAVGPLRDDVECAECEGSRLKPAPSAVRFRGLTIADIVRQSLGELHQTLLSWQLDQRQQKIAGEVLTQIIARTEFLLDVGLEYLSLSRAANSLSGGESQRIRLASQLGSGLCGVMYVLDEPTIGLHPRDNGRLLSALTKLRDLGNTLIVVEHDREIIAGSDVLCDFGPGAGRHGGQLVAQGSPKKIAKDKQSVTGPYLSGTAAIPIPSNRREPKEHLGLRGARAHTLNDVDVDFPTKTLTVITGPSGSGKSTLINDVLYPALQRRTGMPGGSSRNFKSLTGLTAINKVIRVDQAPLGSNPNSTPATYTGLFDLIRQLYAQLPQARARGFTSRQFSFNVPGGRCEKCEGYGQLRIEMHFLPDVWVQCDSCQGKRYTEDTLSVKYHEYSIHDVLQMQAGKALEVFSNIPKIRRILQTLVDVGLDYVALGQSAPTLSGGEAQRVKLAAELSRPDTGCTLYLLDEPTTGLHFSDVSKLLHVLHRLVDMGNTVIVIEHNLDVIKSADWVIDMGPEAGWGGGKVVVAGPPEDVVAHALAERAQTLKASARSTRRSSRPKKAASPMSESTLEHDQALQPLLRSYTGEALAPVLQQGPYQERTVYDHRAALQSQLGDLSLEDIGRNTSPPWASDGRRWHTQDSPSRTGETIQWERQLLSKVIDRIEELSNDILVNWNDRSVVEVTGPTKSKGWFLSANTSDKWLLNLRFRVPRSVFTREQLLNLVSLPTLNQLKEVPLYNNRPRARVSYTNNFHELELDLFRFAEIDSPAFWQWLEEGLTAFLSATMPTAEVEGESWHLQRSGFPQGAEIAWKPETLQALIQMIHKIDTTGWWDWSHKNIVTRSTQPPSNTSILLVTKDPKQIHLVFRVIGPLPALLAGIRSDARMTVEKIDDSGANEITLFSFYFQHFEQLREPVWLTRFLHLLSVTRRIAKRKSQRATS